MHRTRYMFLSSRFILCPKAAETHRRCVLSIGSSDDQSDTTWGSGMIVGLMMETWMLCIYLRRERVLSGAFVNILSVVVEPKMTIFNVSTHFPSLSFLLWSSSVNVPSWIKMMEKQILKKSFYLNPVKVECEAALCGVPVAPLIILY